MRVHGVRLTRISHHEREETRGVDPFFGRRRAAAGHKEQSSHSLLLKARLQLLCKKELKEKKEYHYGIGHR